MDINWCYKYDSFTIYNLKIAHTDIIIIKQEEEEKIPEISKQFRNEMIK